MKFIYFVAKEMLKKQCCKQYCKQCCKVFESYYKRKKLKKDIYDELEPIAWHPDRWWDWCVDIEEKKEIEKLWL